MRLLVFGPGYSASAAIARLQAEADQITATARTSEGAAALEASGIAAVPFEALPVSSGLAQAISSATHILVSIPPAVAGDPVLALADGAILAARPKSLVYLSTVGVYGNHEGGWVSEDTAPRPTSKRSIARLAAEEGWRALASEIGAPLAILRLSGIYGPGRNALVNLAQGTASRVVKSGQVFNRIHVDDIAAAIASAFRKQADGVFNVTDDDPTPPQDVVAYAARLLGVEPPPEVAFDEAELSPMARSFYGENKHVRNTRLKRELVGSLAYPTFRDGLTALWAAGEGRSGG